jgi:hypothetical protein
MGMTKSGFTTMARQIVFGTAFAAVLAVGCGDYNSNNNPPYTGTGGLVQCITYRNGGATGTSTGTGGTTGVDAGNNNADGGTVACNPNGTGNNNNGTTTTTGSGGTGTTGTGGTGTTGTGRGPRTY